VFRSLDILKAAILEVRGRYGLIGLLVITGRDTGSACVLETGLNESPREMEQRFNSMISILDPETCARLEVFTRRIEQPDQATRKFERPLCANSIDHIDELSTRALCLVPNVHVKEPEDAGRVTNLMTDSGHLIIADCANRNATGDLGLRSPIPPSWDCLIHQPPEVSSKFALKSGFTETERLWTSRREFGRLGQVLASNRPVSYSLTSHFVLHFAKTGAPDSLQDS